MPKRKIILSYSSLTHQEYDFKISFVVDASKFFFFFSQRSTDPVVLFYMLNIYLYVGQNLQVLVPCGGYSCWLTVPLRTLIPLPQMSILIRHYKTGSR